MGGKLKRGKIKKRYKADIAFLDYNKNTNNTHSKQNKIIKKSLKKEYIIPLEKKKNLR